MASPNTAGVAALVLSAGPGRQRARRQERDHGARPTPSPTSAGKSVTGGRVNAERAVAGAVGGAPANVTPPAITGTPRQGIALSASTGTWSPAGASYGYVWQRSFDGGATWTAIAGATALDLHPGRVGHRRASCASRSPPPTRTAWRARPRRRSARSRRAPRSPPAAPVINGTLRRGQVLTISGAWNPAGTSYAYQWQRSTDGGITWTTIGSDASSYTLTTAEREARVRVTVTATNAFGQTSVTSDPVGPVALRLRPSTPTPPVVSGTTQRSFTLTAAPGTWGGTGNTYTLPAGSATTAAAGRRSAGATDLDLQARQGGRGRARPRARDGHQRGRQRRAGQRRRAPRRSPRSRRPTPSRRSSPARRSAAGR